MSLGTLHWGLLFSIPLLLVSLWLLWEAVRMVVEERRAWREHRRAIERICERYRVEVDA